MDMWHMGCIIAGSVGSGGCEGWSVCSVGVVCCLRRRLRMESRQCFDEREQAIAVFLCCD